MSKYKRELKLEVVNYVLEHHNSTTEASRKYNVNISMLKMWVRKYSSHGVTGLMRNIQKYDGKFKNYVIEYMHNNHLSLTETAIKFNIANHNIVGKWERIYYEEGPQALFEERRGKNKNMNAKPDNKKITKEIGENLIDEI